ncbi:receptor-like protein kinase FERONIA isoform X2 [Manihot esculenta]|uniref:Uncharacterized protein n=1 Tax=Manihot esculenta TaxID=3983 RepID=A0ACB7IEP2_MANES|nr:receptor-like protein kinase FERONIA isoform X2 [Manihot esculenta]KAG8662358.1 hypothetical protein MANES_01G093901v8 [Manihot esculenta]
MRNAITLLFLSLLFHHTLLISGNDSIALDCGSTIDGPAKDGRNWTADTSSKFFLLDPTNASKIYSALKSPMSDTVPYRTARLSRSEFTYAFPVTLGSKFIRLHFFPSSYPDFTSSVDFFSVKANRYTLLSNFSSALYAQASGSDSFPREFCVNVEDGQMLNITFVPTPGVDAYAFVSGIEIVSMPTDLFYTEDIETAFKFVGSERISNLSRRTALELMHRIDVGGGSIEPPNDTGMFRSWNSDEEYLTIAKPGAYLSNLTIQFEYRDNRTRYAAPDLLYRTARSMGMDKENNENYNLTWEFPVDSNFTYLVRLHFCEFQPLITQKGDRVFMIYIATKIAEAEADVIEWSGGNGIPVFKDYVVTIEPKGNQKLQNISISLHPRTDQTVHADAILNGLEIFKLSSSSDNLAAPNHEIPQISPPTVATPIPKTTKLNGYKTPIGAIIGGAVSGFLVLSFLFFFIFRRRLKVKNSDSSDAPSWWGPFAVSSTKSAKTQGSTLPSDICRRFSLAEIKEATNNFDSVFIIGVGGFGNVYKGLINDGATTVAIKRLNPESQQGANEFKTEIEMLSQLRYLHLVSLIGYCYEDREMILVYDYMAQGTLRDHLYKTDNPPLSWNQRLEICIGAARGLQYLHSGAKNTIIHRDVKTTNILLDEKWVAKVSDFGLSKIGPSSMSKPHISTVVKGSFGYLDPEYCRFQRLTEKSDVYSFGVVLCEVLSARPAVNRSAVETPASLAEWARQCYSKGIFDEIIDPYLQGKIAPDCLRKFAEVAVSCLRDNGVERPSMSDVVWGLEFALQLQETAIKHCRLPNEIDIDMEIPTKGTSVADSSDDMFSSGSELMIGSRLSGMTFTSSSGEQSFLNNNSEKVKSGAIFSEINNPTGR